MYRGFSWQSEYHLKEIVDKLNDDITTPLRGYYFQAGYFFHESIPWWPRPMELALRYAGYYPDNAIRSEQETESSAALNWFFNGHKNKLTTEINYLRYSNSAVYPAEEWRFRIQWDISL